MGATGGRAGQLLHLVHADPGTSRADASRRLGISSGLTSDLVTALVEAELLVEGDPVSRGRGRPTRPLLPHPRGPLVLGASITHEGWRVATVELGGRVLVSRTGRHDGTDPARVLAAVRTAGRRLARPLGTRVRGWGISGPGLVHDGRFLDAPQLGWRHVDLHAVGASDPDLVVVAGNDATLAAAGEAVRGAAESATAHLHLHLDAGIGGALTRAGVPELGAHGFAGEFGHMPFGDPSRRCPCGALGCWGEELGGAALARSLGVAEPSVPVAFAELTLAEALRGDVAARQAVGELAAALGRGIGGLVNAFDPDLVTLGGFGSTVLEVAGADVREACAASALSFRSVPLPEIGAAALGADGPLLGAAELCWAAVLPTL